MIKCYCLLLFTSFLFTTNPPKTEFYRNGHNGVVLISESQKGTIIISTFHSKMSIKEEIAQKIFEAFQKKEFKTGTIITVAGNNAKVTGKFFVRTKNRLTLLDFYYQKIVWDSGITEIYQKKVN